jgi:peptidoglycan/LPS O-acetylase OafA/YrhL
MTRLPGLEALRGIAALSVLGLHVAVIFPGLARPFGKGYLGVDLFFLLSGLVLAMALERRPVDWRAVPRWFVSRYWRMWPVMAIGGLVGAPLLLSRAGGMEQFAPLALVNFLLLPVDFQRETFPLNVPAWTIAFILFGNLLHVTLLCRLGPKVLLAALLASLCALAVVAMTAGTLDVGARPENLHLGLPRLLFSYLLGIALWRWWSAKRPDLAPPILALLATPLLIVAAWAMRFDGWWFDLGFVVLAAPLIVVGVMRLQGWEGIAGFLGKLSFPLYAVHFPLLIWARNWGLAWWGGILLALVAGYAAMLIESRLFSAPSRK